MPEEDAILCAAGVSNPGLHYSLRMRGGGLDLSTEPLPSFLLKRSWCNCAAISDSGHARLGASRAVSVADRGSDDNDDALILFESGAATGFQIPAQLASGVCNRSAPLLVNQFVRELWEKFHHWLELPRGQNDSN